MKRTDLPRGRFYFGKMIAERSVGVSDKPLSQIDCCAVCLEEIPCLDELKGRLSREELKYANYWTQDHVISRVACRQHKSIFAGLRNDEDNLLALCRRHHRQIDNKKQRDYFEKDVSGLLLYITNEYPRSINPIFAQIQQIQFKRLLEGVLRNITDPGGYPLSDYKSNVYQVTLGCLESLEGPPPPTPLIYRREVDKLQLSNIHYLMFS